MDDDLGDDADFIAALHSASGPSAGSKANTHAPQSNGKVQQPKPQALPTRTGPSSILVSPRQKGNPILQSIRALPWEYSDIPADYVLGTTTCALFLSLKYHRLHPEYIYNRIRDLAGKYALRVILTMVDIQNHEEPLKELSKTSLINNVTIILCWSAQEAGRYLELYKSFEGAAPTSIKAHQSTNYSDKLVDFITVPRSINKTDAVGLVSSFGSVRTAVTARPEEIALVDGWGEKKVQRWCNTVREPFRVKKAARKVVSRELSRAEVPEDRLTPMNNEEEATLDPRFAARLGIAGSVPSDVMSVPASDPGQAVFETRRATRIEGPDEDEENAFLEADGLPQTSAFVAPAKRKPTEADLSTGISAELERLRRG